MYAEPPESMEQLTDQSVLPNINANWVNSKGMVLLQMNLATVVASNELLIH